MTELVSYLVKALVEEPAAVRVRAVENPGLTVYEVTVAPQDLGRVIGRQGRIINALRTVVRAAASKNRQQATVEIVSSK